MVSQILRIFEKDDKLYHFYLKLSNFLNHIPKNEFLTALHSSITFSYNTPYDKYQLLSQSSDKPCEKTLSQY